MKGTENQTMCMPVIELKYVDLVVTLFCKGQCTRVKRKPCWNGQTSEHSDSLMIRLYCILSMDRSAAMLPTQEYTVITGY